MGNKKSMGYVFVKELWVYPVKSFAGISCDRLTFDQTGLLHDRLFVVTNRDGLFQTQRSHPKMCLMQPHLMNGHWELEWLPTGERITLDETMSKRSSVRVWKDQVPTLDLGDQISHFVSERLDDSGETSLRLHKILPERLRSVDPRYTDEKKKIPFAFADGFPLLIANQASLVDLNRRLVDADQNTVSMDRFRANIVVDAPEPFEEDRWLHLNGRDIGVKIVKPCARCVVINVDQQTGMKSQEPLRTLGGYRYRKVQKGVIFGQNGFAAAFPSAISRGEKLEVVYRE